MHGVRAQQPPDGADAAENTIRPEGCGIWGSTVVYTLQEISSFSKLLRAISAARLRPFR